MAQDASDLFGAPGAADDLFASLGDGSDVLTGTNDWLDPAPAAASAPTATPLAPPVRDVPLVPAEVAKPSNPYTPPAPSNPYALPAVQPKTPQANPYLPPTNPYAPPTPAKSSFGAYAPPPTPSSAKSPYSTSTPTRTDLASSPYGGQKVAVPPPPAPAPQINRPKVSNAYDPPIFATTNRRQASATQTQNSAYARYASPLPPPPPLGSPSASGFTQSGYALPPPPPGPTPTASPVAGRASGFTQSGYAVPPPPAPTTTASAYPSPPTTTTTPSGYALPPAPSAPPGRASPAPNWASPPMRAASPAKPPPARAASRAESISSVRSRTTVDEVQRTASPASFIASPVSPVQSILNGDRTSSPAPSLSSLEGARSPPAAANPYLPRAASPLKKPTLNVYEPPPQVINGYGPEANGVPSQFLPKGSHHVPPPLLRNRSESSSSAYNPPAKNGHLNQQRSETDYGSGAYTSRYNYGETPAYAAQEVVVKPAAQSNAYAPSPSLLGANDPLGRTASRAPVFSFGFGGKFLTCFHGASINTGFDVALASKNSTGVEIRQLSKLIPQSALETSAAVYPGPLFSDPGTPTTGLVRATTSTQTKAKKTKLVKYLTDRAAEISQAIGYLNAGTPESQQAEGKLVLVKLLKVLVENDGKLSGTPQIDSAVRAALVPRLETASEEDTSGSFTSIADIQQPMANGIVYSNGLTSDAPLATSVLRPAALEKIQEFLVRGERRKAYHFALDEKLWAHAMVIASSIDRDAWKEAVNEFLRTELAPSTVAADSTQPKVGHEGLRVAYSLYSGQGSVSVQEMVPQNLLARATGRLQLPSSSSHKTPLTPNFAAPAVANTIPTESLATWAETAAMMLSSPMTTDTSSALTALGDQLLAHQWVEAAHACYLLSPQTSPLGGLGNANARIVLLGSKSPSVWASFYKDSDPVIFTEILEYALSLNPPPKGQDAFFGFPHLQAYRFIRAASLAEMGEIQLANRYCEAISVSFSRGSPYFTPTLLEQLKALSDRVVGVDHNDKSGFWKSTPSLDTIGRFLEGRFTKLVTGDMDPGTPIEEQTKMNEARAAGPFGSQYSSISSTTTSTNPSPQPSMYNLNAQAPPPATQPPRAGSAMGQSAYRLPPPPHAPVDRAASAMDHVRHRPSPPPAPRISSANASTTTFAQSSSHVSAYSNYTPSPYSPNMNMQTPRPTQETHDEADAEGGGQEVSWWGSTSYASDSANQTPMAATFHQVEASVVSNSDSEGFISLMDTSSYSVAPVAARKQQASSTVEEEEEDDLGFGNSKSKPKKETGDANGDAAPAESAQPQRPDANPVQGQQSAAAAASGGSWFGRWWKRSDAAPGPVKANLGEETSFYYDKELKRWVNKSGGAEAAKPAAPPPPPPSRPQTASPGLMSGPRRDGMTPPPPRAASVAPADLNGNGGPPSRPPTRSEIRSSSPLSGPPLSAPSPPPSRPKSQASSKRAIRSRYVDVFQQEGAGAA
uniref:Protein transport protein sec16 n=1 Tax=Mycena chlorophos TaxID=658473 RepID=A0ABQ0LQ55_MYCCL|nr:copII vesicle coat protein [Mycena chlorophos]